MSVVQPALFFLCLPDLKSLCSVTLTLHDDYEEPRSKQLSTCRELVLLFSDVLAAPGLDSFTEITAVMAIQFFQRGVLQSFIQRHCLQMSPPEQVYPGTLQSCVSFAVTSRLSPNWNKAGLYLVNGKFLSHTCGRDFLSERGRLSAVSLELSVSEGKLCLSLRPHTVRLPPITLPDLELSPLVLNRFCSDPDSVLDLQSTGGAMWCHVLPSMKMGQIISISRKLPPDGPFRSYSELQQHWNRLYGYELPEQEQLVYCSVYFKLVGQRLFTYPLCCIRLSPVQRCPRVDLEGALSRFTADVRGTLPSVCGFPTRLSAKSAFTTATLTPASIQISDDEDLNLTEFSGSRAVLTQLPPPPPAPRPMKPVFGSQPATAPPLCSSFSDVFKPASSINPFFSVFQSQPSPPPPPPVPEPRFVPVFRRQQPSQIMDVSLLRERQEIMDVSLLRERQEIMDVSLLRERQEIMDVSLLRERQEIMDVSLLRERQVRADRLTLPTVSGLRAATFPAKAMSGAQRSATVRRIPTFSPKHRLKRALILDPEGIAVKEVKKAMAAVKFNLEETEGEEPKPAAKRKKGVLEKSALTDEEKKAQSSEGEEKASGDVETMAKNCQLYKVRSSKMRKFLLARGVDVPHKLPKNQLMLTVMSCLAER